MKKGMEEKGMEEKGMEEKGMEEKRSHRSRPFVAIAVSLDAFAILLTLVMIGFIPAYGDFGGYLYVVYFPLVIPSLVASLALAIVGKVKRCSGAMAPLIFSPIAMGAVGAFGLLVLTVRLAFMPSPPSDYLKSHCEPKNFFALVEQDSGKIDMDREGKENIDVYDRGFFVLNEMKKASYVEVDQIQGGKVTFTYSPVIVRTGYTPTQRRFYYRLYSSYYVAIGGSDSGRLSSSYEKVYSIGRESYDAIYDLGLSTCLEQDQYYRDAKEEAETTYGPSAFLEEARKHESLTFYVSVLRRYEDVHKIDKEKKVLDTLGEITYLNERLSYSRLEEGEAFIYNYNTAKASGFTWRYRLLKDLKRVEISFYFEDYAKARHLFYKTYEISKEDGNKIIDSAIENGSAY